MLHRLNLHNPDIPRSSNNSSLSDTLYFAKSLFSTLIYRRNNNYSIKNNNKKKKNKNNNNNNNNNNDIISKVG